MSKRNTSKSGEQEQTMEWCGYNWKSTMEGGRRIHPDNPWYWYSMDCTYVDSDDVLHIYTRKNPKEFKHWDGKTYSPTMEVGTLRTLESFEYGRFSAEIIVPKGRNLCPAFWLSGEGNWPPEIDIEEGWPNRRGSYYRTFKDYFPWFGPSWRTTTNVHYREDDLRRKHIGSHNICLCAQPKNPTKNYVKYECEWLPDSIRFFVNGKEIRKVGESVCRKMRQNLTDPEKGFRMNVLLNVWTGNPETDEVYQTTDMLVRNFKYERM